MLVYAGRITLLVVTVCILMVWGMRIVGTVRPAPHLFTFTLYPDRQPRQTDIFLLDLQSGVLVNLSQTPSIPEWDSALSAQQDRIAYVRPIQSDYMGSTALVIQSVMEYDRTKPVYQMNGIQGSREQVLLQPRWSPDDAQIAYAAYGSSTQLQAHILTVDSEERQKLVSSAQSTYGPSWSASGEHLLFSRTTPRGESDVYVLPADCLPACGTDVIRPLTAQSGIEFFASASPDGEWIVFVNADPFNVAALPQLYLLPTDCLQAMPRCALENAAPLPFPSSFSYQVNQAYPVWSADSQAIYFTAFRPSIFPSQGQGSLFRIERACVEVQDCPPEIAFPFIHELMLTY
jgi:Tol biopolymer transport system component